MSEFKSKGEVYKFISWDKDEEVTKIMDQLEEEYKSGWEVVSHSHSIYGMSVILIKEK